MQEADFFVHESSYVDDGVVIGAGTRIWHFSHVLTGAKIGCGCNLGQNVSVAGGAVIGNNVKIQNNVSVFSGVEIEDDVFLGPSCVLTNINNPRAEVDRKNFYEKTRIKRGATVGANATVICGVTLGRYSFVAAGAVVTNDLPDYAFCLGVPAKQVGWISRHGHRLQLCNNERVYICPESGLRYKEDSGGRLFCLDIDENAPLPQKLKVGTGTYRDFKK